MKALLQKFGLIRARGTIVARAAQAIERACGVRGRSGAFWLWTGCCCLASGIAIYSLSRLTQPDMIVTEKAGTRRSAMSLN